VGGGINGKTEAFARVRIDALPDGTQADQVLCDRQEQPVTSLSGRYPSVLGEPPAVRRGKPGNLARLYSQNCL